MFITRSRMSASLARWGFLTLLASLNLSLFVEGRSGQTP
jgi:hypothetical protein